VPTTAEVGATRSLPKPTPTRGTTWRQVVVAGKNKLPYDLTVDQYEQNRMYRFKGIGSALDYKVICGFDSSGAGTRVSIGVSGRVKGFAKIFGGTIGRTFREAITSSAESLRTVLESRT